MAASLAFGYSDRKDRFFENGNDRIYSFDLLLVMA